MSGSPKRIALLGASGIGAVHYRILHALGAEVPVILGSSQHSAEKTAQKLNDDFGTQTIGLPELKDVLAYDLDGVVICTPPALHLDQLHLCLDHHLPVFCEKPLFWNNGTSPQQVVQNLSDLEQKANGRLMVNTSNTMLASAAVTHFNADTQPNRFYFRFDTMGKNTGADIAMDLLPHGLSLLLELHDSRNAQDFSFDVDTHTAVIDFRLGDCQVTFDLKEDPDGDRFLGFSINDRSFSRVQEGTGASYKVYLQEDKNESRHELVDPFRSYLASFLSLCGGETPSLIPDFKRDSHNLRIMAECMDALSAEDT